MVVLIVTGSMRKPPLNCSISGLETLQPIMRKSEYDGLLFKLGVDSDPYPGQVVFVRFVSSSILNLGYSSTQPLCQIFTFNTFFL